MAHTPADSAIKIDKKLEEAIANAPNGEFIKEIMRQAMVDQGLATRAWDSSILEPVEQALAPRAYTTTVQINGVKHILEASTQEGLNRQETALYRAALQGGTNEPTPRDPQGRFTAEPKASVPAVSSEPRADAAIDTAAIEAYLRAQHIDPEALKTVSGEQAKQKWEKATQEFLRTSDWPGGEANKRALGEKLIEMKAEPSANSLRRAYEELKRSNSLSENPELALEKKIAGARDAGELREILGQHYGGTSMWGR